MLTCVHLKPIGVMANGFAFVGLRDFGDIPFL
jgi:hypothetical protein